jgi:hypothetical protein
MMYEKKFALRMIAVSTNPGLTIETMIRPLNDLVT